MSRIPLTLKQSQVFRYLLDQVGQGMPPTVREICRATGIKSTSSVHKILDALEDMGYIRREKNASRSIRIEGTAGAVQVPVLGRVTAGQPILAVEQIEDYIPYPADRVRSGNLFALHVSGYSMKNAGILDGDVVIADRDAPWRAGDIVIALIGEEATVKRLAFEGAQPVLLPENPEFDPIYPEALQILGKVVGSYRSY